MWRGVVEIIDKVAKEDEVRKVTGTHMSGLES